MTQEFTFTGPDGREVKIPEERYCPLVSTLGPECPNCGSEPLSANLDPYNKTAICQECGTRYRIPKPKRKKNS